MVAMAPPRVSAFSVFQQEKKKMKPQLGLKKGTVSKSSQKLHKKNKKSKSKSPLRNSEAQEDASGKLHPITSSNKKKSSKNLGKTPCNVSNGKGLQNQQLKGSENGNKQHMGPPLASVLQNLGQIQNSRERANTLFEWLISPLKPEEFFRCIWETRPALLKRHNSKYYDGFFSTAEFDRILREDNVQFGVNLDVTSYTDGVRETHNPSGRALPMVVWDYYKNGCSLRLLNPQSFSSPVWNVLSVLQELFGSMVGANTYLTPPGTQGFAPHYDDIEAFVVQLEGKKHWRVYSPRNSSETLPQFSSVNFNDGDIGEPILETILEAGDLLYFPRGFIHQGDCLPDAHSLHITVSSFQRNSWADLLDKLLPAALQIAAEDDVEFRKGLPLDYLDYMGVQNAESLDPRKQNFIQKAKELIRKLAEYAPVDAAVDQKAKAFLHDCLPPLLTPAEKDHSVYGTPARWENGAVRDCLIQLEKDSHIRFLRGGIARIKTKPVYLFHVLKVMPDDKGAVLQGSQVLFVPSWKMYLHISHKLPVEPQCLLCSEGDACLLYYSTDNSRVYHREEPKSIEVDAEHVDAIEYLLHCYPQYVTVESLPCEDLDDKVVETLDGSTVTIQVVPYLRTPNLQTSPVTNGPLDILAVANMLFEKGLLISRERLAPIPCSGENE